MNILNYNERIADILLVNALDSSGAVLIEGPKWCGKTWTALNAAKSSLLMQDPDESSNYLMQANVKPSLLLEGEAPRLLDEWQTAPVLWDAVRFAVDKRGKVGQFILTGSTMPLLHDVMHTGTGRISRIKMRTMSLYESRESNGQVSLSQLFNGMSPEGESSLTIEELAFLVARGGWPASIQMSSKPALAQANKYYDAILAYDIYEASSSSRELVKMGFLMRSLARNVATVATIETLRKDVFTNRQNLAINTVQSYLDILERLFVIDDQPAWDPKLRSKTYLRKSAKRHFVDPSIAVAALKTNPEGLLKDFNTFGLLFESLCIRDLRIYSQALNGEVYHYNDNSGLEVDAIISLDDGRWGAIEIKMGQRQVEEASANLLKLRDKIDTQHMNPPSFLAVVTGNGYALRQENGVLVVPIGCLKD